MLFAKKYICTYKLNIHHMNNIRLYITINDHIGNKVTNKYEVMRE